MMSVAEEVAWLSGVTRQSAADLLAVPATVFYALRDRALCAVIAQAKQDRVEESARNREQLMADLKKRMGRA